MYTISHTNLHVWNLYISKLHLQGNPAVNFLKTLKTQDFTSSTCFRVCRRNHHMYKVSNWLSSLIFLGFALLFFFYKNPSPEYSNMAEAAPKSVYDFTIKDIHGNDVSLSSHSGKVLLIVNVASKCGLTHSNYKELNILYEKYKDQGFEILAFPCNQFAGQEPGSNEEIQQVACTMFKAEFPIFDKVEVNGKNSAPLYKFLKSQKGGILGDAIKWNFTKFLVDKNGKVVERYAPTTSPLKIEKDIQNLLGTA